jgi:hypothetical protein
MSPIFTSRAGLAGCPLDWILPSSQARVASERVLKNLAAHSHLSMRTEVIRPFSYKKQGCAFALHASAVRFFEREQYSNYVLIKYRDPGDQDG